MKRAKSCSRVTCTKRRPSYTCRLPSCGCMRAKGVSKQPSQGSAGCSWRTTLLRISVSFTLADGKRR